MSEISGRLINMKLRVNGTADAFKTLVCTENSTFQITSDVNERRTNCGVKTSVATPTFNASGTAVQNVEPTAAEASYNDVKAWIKAGTKLDFQYISEADAGNGFAEGDAVSNTGSGYFTDVSYNASAEADGQPTFDWTFTGTGTIDEYDDESPS